MVKQKIFSRKCPECKKEISSLYENQFEYNWEQHELSHKRGEGDGSKND